MKVSQTLLNAVVLFTVTGAAQAALLDRGGGLIYDTALNVTWLADANYAKTSLYDADGQMTWSQATAWASSLSFYDSVRKVTYTDWRLPNTGPVDGVAMTPEPFPGGYVSSVDGSTEVGYNVSAPGSAFPGSKGSEMAYLFYNELGNKGYYGVNGVYQPDSGLVNTGPFINFQPSIYWSGTEYGYGDAWTFSSDGLQKWRNKSALVQTGPGNYYTIPIYALAVRPGDVAAVPEADTWALLLVGLGLVGTAVRRRR